MNKEKKPLPRRQPSRIDLLVYFKQAKNLLKKAASLKYGKYAIITLAVALLLILFYLGDSFAFRGKIHAGVNIDSVDLSGLTKEEAVGKLRNAYGKLPEKEINIEYKNRNWLVRSSQFEIRLKPLKTADEAFKYGRNGNLINRIFEKLSCLSGVKLKGKFSYNKNKFENHVRAIVDSVSSPATDAGIEIAGNIPKLIPSKKGIGLDFNQTANAVFSKVTSLEERKLNLKPEVLYPEITDKEAKKSLKLAGLMVKNPVKVKYKTRKFTLDGRELALCFATKPLSSNNGLYLYLDPKAIEKQLLPDVKDLIAEPVSATFHVSGKDVWISPSKEGLKIDFRKTAESATVASKKKEKRISELSVLVLKPERSTKKAKDMGIKTLVSSFTTSHPGGAPRVTNIHKAADILDKRLIAPGASFSFNDYVGQRTAAGGFVAAPEIRSGELVPTIGGGICQVATTFFNTILLGGYPFGQRSPHTLYITKYPNGRDAAVSWPSPDLTFTNDTDAWIMIKAGYSSTSITINFYSTDYGRKVEFDTKFLGYIPFGTKVVKDPTLIKGERKEEQRGKQGRSFKVTRKVYLNGKVIRQESFTSRYRPQERIVLEGTRNETREERLKREAEEKEKKEAEG